MSPEQAARLDDLYELERRRALPRSEDRNERFPLPQMLVCVFGIVACVMLVALLVVGA